MMPCRSNAWFEVRNVREMVNKINQVNFTATDDIHTLGLLYESMLKEMRDAAGDSGEFYTPRAVVKFMVHVTDPPVSCKTVTAFNPPAENVKDCATASLTAAHTGN